MLAKYLLMLALFMGLQKISYAQDTAATGEIVMTKSQLKSFLGKIVQLKKQQMKEQKEMNLPQVNVQPENFSSIRDHRIISSYPEQPEIDIRNQRSLDENRQSNPTVDERLYTQLELINAKLNLVMSEIEVLKLRTALNNGSGNNPSDNLYLNPNPQQPQVRVEPRQQPVIINQGAPSQPYVQYIPQPQVTTKEKLRKRPTGQPQDSAFFAGQQAQAKLKERISGLENELSLLQQLLQGGDDQEKNQYQEEISNINAQIDSLHTRLNMQTKDADSLMEKKESNLLHVLNDFSYKVYFGNNSTAIPPSDYSKLEEIVRIAQNNPQATVVLRGFASKAGNPQYNEKISFQRAVAVKNWLLENGLPLKNILTMHHGIDNSVDAARARRVEISFRVQ